MKKKLMFIGMSLALLLSGCALEVPSNLLEVPKLSPTTSTHTPTVTTPTPTPTDNTSDFVKALREQNSFFEGIPAESLDQLGVQVCENIRVEGFDTALYNAMGETADTEEIEFFVASVLFICPEYEESLTNFIEGN